MKTLLTRAEIISLHARAMNAARKTRGGGRPRSNKPRCACGAMTRKRAKARGHKCDGE
jgi:hypothetical protein